MNITDTAEGENTEFPLNSTTQNVFRGADNDNDSISPSEELESH